MSKRLSVKEIQKLKGTKGQLFFITAHDAPSAKTLEAAGVPLILVGDSVANTVFGYDSTVSATPEMILHHLKAVVRNTVVPMVIADVPFMRSYDEQTLFETARLYMQEGGAHGIKIECYHESQLPLIQKLTAFGVPVIAHLGLTPQLFLQKGYAKQGKTEDEHRKMLRLAEECQSAGVACLLLECVPDDLARTITQSVSIPVIGIGAGPDCDGQAHVFNDIVGLSDGAFKHARTYMDTKKGWYDAVRAFMSNEDAKKQG